MKNLVTAVGTYLTGDDIADAVLDLWRTLAQTHDADIVDVLFLDGAGVPSRVRLAVGWGLPLAAVNSSSPASLADPSLVSAIRARARSKDGGMPFLPHEIVVADETYAV